MWRRERPAVFTYRFYSVWFCGGNYHPLMGSDGEDVVAVYI